MIEQGYYSGTIVNSYLATRDDDTELSMVFVVELEGERAGGQEVVCEQRCGGQYPDIAVRVAEHLGLKWPDGLEEIKSTEGKKVTVKVKHNEFKGKTYVNAHIALPRSGPKEADPATAKKLIRKLADSGNVPF